MVPLGLWLYTHSDQVRAIPSSIEIPAATWAHWMQIRSSVVVASICRATKTAENSMVWTRDTQTRARVKRTASAHAIVADAPHAAHERSIRTVEDEPRSWTSAAETNEKHAATWIQAARAAIC